MKKIYIFIIIIALIAGGIGIYLYNKNKTSSNNSSQKLPPYNATKVSTNNEISNTNSQGNTTNSGTDTSKNQLQENTQPSSPTVETEIANFTTKIYTKDSDRQTNISLTCSSLNDTTVENGQTFSFCDTVGKASSSKGYKKADVFVDGKKIEALGRSETAK